jgi:putative DNA-invertase from lambdoid prophage Rac
MGVRVHCLQLGGTDLTSPAGRMVMGVIGAMAEFERDLLIERTQSGLKRDRGKYIIRRRGAETFRGKAFSSSFSTIPTAGNSK